MFKLNSGGPSLADSDPTQRIVIEHPDIEGRSIVQRVQLETVWAKQGFKEVKGIDPDNPSPSADTLPAPEPMDDPAPAASATAKVAKPKEAPKTGGSN